MTTQNELTNSQVLNAMVSSSTFRSSKKAHANRSVPVAKGAVDTDDVAVLFLDGDIAPEGAAISEQPEISAMHRMQANEMHRVNAQRGVAFASQSEHTSGDAKERLRDSRRKDDDRRTSLPKQRFGNNSRKHASRSSPQRDDNNDNSSSSGSGSSSRSRRGDSSTEQEISSATQERNLSESRDEFDQITASSPSAARSRVAKKDIKPALADADVADQQQQEQTAQPSVNEKLPWHKRASDFFKKNLMVVLALVVLLIFCGVGAYLYIKTKIEARKRAADRAEMQAVLEQEEALPRRDAAIDQLRAENAALRIATEQAREICAAFEQKMSEAEKQNHEQMDTIEKLSLINEDWSNNYAVQMEVLQQQQERLQQLEHLQQLERLQQEELEKEYALQQEKTEPNSAAPENESAASLDAQIAPDAKIENVEQVSTEPEPESD